MFLLPPPKRKTFSFLIDPVKKLLKFLIDQRLTVKTQLTSKRGRYAIASILDLVVTALIVVNGIKPAQRLISPLITPLMPLSPLQESKASHEVFGFAPYWTFNKLSNVDFNVLTTFSYFGVPVGADGNLVTDGVGYQTFQSKEATDIFKKAHASGTRVVLTLTQMNNQTILSLMDDQDAQNRAIDQAVSQIKNRGIDGINVDFEYSSNPGDSYRQKFSNFVANLTSKMHQEIPQSKVTVSVYASAIKEPKIYDIASLGRTTDGIFMMAYDFAVASSDNAIPTSPLHGAEKGKYWYDVATAVADFLAYVPPQKLILGTPWYGYDHLVYEPQVKALTRPYYSWRGQPVARTYTNGLETINKLTDVDQVTRGWDPDGQVGYVAYHIASTDTWRMLFLEDPKSLGIKYDFAISKHLAGVGVWALGFDDGHSELWSELTDKFGDKLADKSVLSKVISDAYAQGNQGQ